MIGSLWIDRGRWVVAVLGLAVCGCGGKPVATAEVKKADRAVPVTVARLERRVVERTVDVIGTLRGWEQVTVGAKRTGRVVKVDHDIGDRVRPGEPLVELDPVDARLAVDQAESKYLGELVKLGITRRQAEEFVKKYGVSEELLMGHVADEAITRVPSVIQKRVTLEKAEQDLRRQRALNSRGAGTAQELEDSESQARTSQANYDDAVHTARTVIATAVAAKVALEQARQELKDTIVTVPSPHLLPPGVDDLGRITYGVTRRQTSEGQMIKEGEAVVELVVEDPLRLWCQVPEQYVGDVKIGQKARITTRAYDGKVFEGEVSRINPSVDPANRTFQVETVVSNTRRLLRPGGFARASIVVDSHARAAVVPIESIVRFAGVTKIFIVDGGFARVIGDVKTGREGRGWIEISGKLPETAEVVTSGQTRLADGTPVVVREPERKRTSPPAGQPPANAGSPESPGRPAAVQEADRR